MALESQMIGDDVLARSLRGGRVPSFLGFALLLMATACSNSDDNGANGPGYVGGGYDSGIHPVTTPDAGSTGGGTTGGAGGAPAGGLFAGGATLGGGGLLAGGSGGGGLDAGGTLDAGTTLDAGGGGADASAGDSGSGDASSGTDGGAGGACTRDSLKATIDKYYAALAAHDPSMVPIAPTAKYTENGKKVDVGQGFWKTAGAVKFKRSALDTQVCGSTTESVVPDGSTDRVYGVRLKSQAGMITEIESIIIHPGDYFTDPNPQAIIDSKSDDWETVLPPDQRATREKLTDVVNRYFKLFPSGACGFMDGCTRLENGFAPPGFDCNDLLDCDMTTDVTSIPGNMPSGRLTIDVEAGIAVGFTMFMNTYTDFHMFKVRGGQVVGVHAVLASASSSGWD